ncbi:MAG: hypothetical protein ABW360_02775 [Phenylobacterium sp.]
MDPSSVAGVITAVATCLIALGGLVGAVTLLVPILRGTKNNAAAIEATGTAVTEIHVMVNQRLTDAQRYQERLMEELVAHGIAVPRDTSLRAPGGGPAV